MPLAPGTQLGPYHVLGPLGAGGMGEVYRASDSRLGRELALKVLPELALADAGRLRRFEQEARALAALNHPNLLVIYDVGEADGVPYLASELLRGETLDAHLKAGAMPARKAVEVAREIAAGLAAAHEQGIVHRDLKPANIFLTVDGRVKILDFGLAKLSETASAEAPTQVGAAATTPGMTLGTAGYMAPEQVRGESADARADIFALGAVLYEMLTGQRAFQRPTAVETMTAILREEPADSPLTAPTVAPALDKIIRRCLEKQPRQRFQSVNDLGIALDLALGGSAAGSAPALPAAPAARPPRRWPAYAATAVIVAALASAAAWWLRPRPFDLAQLDYTPLALMAGGQICPQFSPDGTAVAFAAAAEPYQPRQVWVRYLDQPTAVQLTRLPEEAFPVGWSPDSKRILFLDQQGVNWISVAGGAPVAWPGLPPPSPFFGNADFSWETYSVALSPDGQHVALASVDSSNHFQVLLSDGRSLQPYQPAPFASTPGEGAPALRYSPDGKHLLLLVNNPTSGRLEAWLLPLPASSGMPRRVLADLPQNDDTPEFAWLPDNRHIVLSAGGYRNGTQGQLWLADVNSDTFTPLSNTWQTFISPAVSPDGRQFAFTDRERHFSAVAVNLQTGAMKPVIPSAYNQESPSWGSGASGMVYVRGYTATQELWLHPPFGSDRPLVTYQRLPARFVGIMSAAISPDGTRAIYTVIENAGFFGYLVPLAGGDPAPLANSENLVCAAWSPDNNRLACLALQNLQPAVVAADANGQHVPTMLVPQIGLALPSWSPDGHWIAYADTSGGWNLVSPDARQHRALGVLNTSAVAFSHDSRTLYGIRNDQGHELFALDLASGRQRVIATLGPGAAPAAESQPGIQFTLTPDGKSLTYTTLDSSYNLWLASGLNHR
ncbi:MAG: protein kinase domain-containing protein [Terriglobales bacterium]